MAGIEFEDVVATINKKISDEFSGIIPIDWDGVGFDTEGETEWLQPTVLACIANPVRYGEHHKVYRLDVNIFVRPQLDAYRHYELADDIVALFEQQDIDLLSGNGMLRFGEIQLTNIPMPIPAEQYLIQVNASVEAWIISKEIACYGDYGYGTQPYGI